MRVGTFYTSAVMDDNDDDDTVMVARSSSQMKCETHRIENIHRLLKKVF